MGCDVDTIKIYGFHSGADLRFLERGFICIKVWRFALLIISHIS